MKQIRITRKAYIYILVFFIFLSFATILRIPQLIFFSLPLIVYIFLGAISFRNGEIEIKRMVENTLIFENESLKFTYIIKSKNIEGVVEIQDNGIVEKFYLKNNEMKKIEKIKKFENFGKYDYSTVRIILNDRFNIFSVLQEMHEDLIIRVYPTPENLRKFQIRPKKTRSIIGDIPSKYIGHGSDFYSIRDFQEGDDIRRMNWKKTAMFDEPMVNDFLTERSGNAVILLDARKYQKSYDDYRKMLKGLVKATLTISTALTRTRNRLGLIILKDTVDWVYPGYGRAQLMKINERLLKVESKTQHYVPLEYGKKIVTRFFPPNSFIIIIGTLFDKEIIDIAIELMAKKYELLVIVPYSIETEKDMVYRIFDAERRVRMRIISKYATVVEWDITKPLTKSMEAIRR